MFTPLDDNWKYTPDDEIAKRVCGSNSRQYNRDITGASLLCNHCRTLQLWLPGYTFSGSVDATEESARCDLCQLLLKLTRESSTTNSGATQFFKVGSALTANDRQSKPVVSIYTNNPVSGFQLGRPQLPKSGSAMHTKVLTEWIHSCDLDHACNPKRVPFLPTRVLDVSGPEVDIVRLFCGTRGQTSPGRYIALSHRWGLPSENWKFCTKKDNLTSRKEGIRVADLPQTFQDAITTTRALSVQYLWIDSICIVQDDAHDWDIESKLMGQVFSSAYVTIAATCASGTKDGFLKPRPTRDCVTIKMDDDCNLYLCNSIDDFNNDVDHGELNTRGWVLQERALSRRTIHFAENQTYWECGEGVRCETLTKMKNKKASFLGDANFPTSVETYVKGMKIELFQSLYQRYSNLSLSFAKDRPIAIKGLEKRLIQTFKTVGGYGVFDCYLYRSLLWKSSRQALERIDSLSDGKVPSWSWMAYTGGIEYLDVPFGRVSWAENIQSPFKILENEEYKNEDFKNDERRASLEIVAKSWRLDVRQAKGLVLDNASCSLDTSTRCVVLGSSKRAASDQAQKHYVLVVSAVHSEQDDLYKRVGVGIVEESQLLKDSSANEIRIV